MFYLLTLAFIVLKLCSVIAWSWFWVLFPLIIELCIDILVSFSVNEESIITLTEDENRFKRFIHELTVALTVLKLCGIISLSWFWVTIIFMIGVIAICIHNVLINRCNPDKKITVDTDINIKVN